MKGVRLKRLAQIMETRGVDRVLIGSDLALFYYTGIYEETMERLRLLLADREGGGLWAANQIFRTEGQALRHRALGQPGQAGGAPDL